MAIIRSERRKNFTHIDNKVFADNVLSFRAMGLLGYLLSKPDNWSVSARHLATVTEKTARPAAINAVHETLKELRQAGFIVMKKRHTGETDYFVFDEPQNADVEVPNQEKPNQAKPNQIEPDVENPNQEKPNQEKPNQEKPDVLINTESKQELNNNNTPLPPNLADENHDCANALVAADATTPDDFENLADEKPASSLKKQQTEKRFTALANLFNQVFAGSNVQTVSLEATKTNASRKRLIPAAWEFAKRRVLTWCDADGLIDGEKPSSKHVLQWFEAYFAQCLADPFINGTSPRSKGHENWKPDFSYLLKATTLEKRILESQP